jgi:hypothetical protein
MKICSKMKITATSHAKTAMAAIQGITPIGALMYAKAA